MQLLSSWRTSALGMKFTIPYTCSFCPALRSRTPPIATAIAENLGLNQTKNNCVYGALYFVPSALGFSIQFFI